MISSGGRCQSNPASPAVRFYQKRHAEAQKMFVRGYASLAYGAEQTYPSRPMTTWTSRAAALKRLKRVARVQQRNSALFVTICSLRQELETKTDATRKLEILLAERCATIDALYYANQKLHLETIASQQC